MSHLDIKLFSRRHLDRFYICKAGREIYTSLNLDIDRSYAGNTWTLMLFKKFQRLGYFTKKKCNILVSRCWKLEETYPKRTAALITAKSEFKYCLSRMDTNTQVSFHFFLSVHVYATLCLSVSKFLDLAWLNVEKFKWYKDFCRAQSPLGFAGSLSTKAISHSVIVWTKSLEASDRGVLAAQVTSSRTFLCRCCHLWWLLRASASCGPNRGSEPL